VKPQFEVGRDHLAKGGVVRDHSAREHAIASIRRAATDGGFEVLGGADSKLAGARSGNVEHFLHLVRR
jgi:23S rRNA (cytidine1920-2'-O)/16S rRNA (cytidine1409-2'-O)-methyltransferase